MLAAKNPINFWQCLSIVRQEQKKKTSCCKKGIYRQAWVPDNELTTGNSLAYIKPAVRLTELCMQ